MTIQILHKFDDDATLGHVYTTGRHELGMPEFLIRNLVPHTLGGEVCPPPSTTLMMMQTANYDVQDGGRLDNDFRFLAVKRDDLRSEMATQMPECNPEATILELVPMLPSEEYFEDKEDAYVKMSKATYDEPCTTCGDACNCPKALSMNLHGESVDVGIHLTATGPVRVYGHGKKQYPMEPREFEATMSLYDDSDYKVPGEDWGHREFSMKLLSQTDDTVQDRMDDVRESLQMVVEQSGVTNTEEFPSEVRTGDVAIVFYACVDCPDPNCFGNAHVVRVLASHEQGGAVVELQIQNHEDRVFRIRDDHVLAVVRASRWGDDDEETDGETDGETEDETDSETGDEGSETD
jgi:hypothetical protein